VLLAAACKSPDHILNDTDITELLSFRYKLLLAGVLNSNNPVRNIIVSNFPRVKLLNLLHIIEFEISAPQYPTHYSPMGNGDMLDIVHKNVRLSEVIVSDILDSHHLPVIFHLLDHIRSRNLSDSVNKFTD
jgi:hypothetical protein